MLRYVVLQVGEELPLEIAEPMVEQRGEWLHARCLHGSLRYNGFQYIAI